MKMSVIALGRTSAPMTAACLVAAVAAGPQGEPHARPPAPAPAPPAPRPGPMKPIGRWVASAAFSRRTTSRVDVAQLRLDRVVGQHGAHPVAAGDDRARRSRPRLSGAQLPDLAAGDAGRLHQRLPGGPLRPRPGCAGDRTPRLRQRRARRRWPRAPPRSSASRVSSASWGSLPSPAPHPDRSTATRLAIPLGYQMGPRPPSAGSAAPGRAPAVREIPRPGPSASSAGADGRPPARPARMAARAPRTRSR